MMDFFVREARAVVDGPMSIVRYYSCIVLMKWNRFGTCGGLTDDALDGTIVVSSYGSGFISRQPDFFSNNYDNSTQTTYESCTDNDLFDQPYKLHKIAPADQNLSALVYSELIKEIDSCRIVEGANVTAESFYSSQGRIDDNFDDHNESVIELALSSYPNLKTMEMETFMLYHLSKCCRIPIYSSAAGNVNF